MKKWRYFHLVQGAYEIAPENNYARGTICVCHNQEEAEMIVEALNDWEAKRAENAKG